MSRIESYKLKTFTVVDPDARVRRADNLMAFEALGDTEANATGFRVIPQNTQVKVDQVRIQSTGQASSIVFAHCLSADGAHVLGWTSTRNFKGKFVNETLGAIPPKDKDKKGANAAWSGGSFVRQVTLVRIVDAKLEIEFIAEDTLEPYLALVEAGAAAGIEVAINDGFRAYPEQKRLHEGYTKGLAGFNQAARPGYSKHQNGIAFDINVPGGAGNPAYDWLIANAPAKGFVRTVDKEPWHWEYDRAKAQIALEAGTFKTPNVQV